MSDEWGPWIEHDGKGCPCRGQIAHVVLKNANGVLMHGTDRRGRYVAPGEWVGLVSPPDHGGSWTWGNGYNPVLRYRIRKPRGLTILEGLLENLPEGVDA